MSAAVRWPTAVDYQMALQTPALCFAEHHLRQGRVFTDKLGLPRAATGNVVVVFRMRLAEGDVALRCFTREASVETMERRYHALSRRFERIDVPALTPCIYRRNEILVDKRRYPVVEMPWKPGLQLHRYIEQHLHEPEVLHALADQWRILMKDLSTARIAHGDLSDGNVLVDEHGQIHLVDFDAAFTPRLADAIPLEVGKPNYQHPGRLSPDSPDYGYYAENVDAFSALAIYVSLRALADDADRWRCYHTGENLIFEQQDYQNPGYTPIWLDLRSGRDDEVRQLVEVLEGFCRAPVADLPTLEEAVESRTPHRPDEAAKAASLAEDKAPVPPEREEKTRSDTDDELTPEAHPDLTTTLRKLYVPALAAVMVFLVVVGVVYQQGQASRPVRYVSLASPAEAGETHVPPEALPGFYTGYATSLDGDREPMALTIDSLDAHPDSAEAHFVYSVNWKAHQVGGAGHYNEATGYVDLENHYVLYIARASDDEVVLASLSHRDHRPLVLVNKRRTHE